MSQIYQIVKKKFGIHRGIESPYALPNSINAIKSAIDLEPLFVEFDVILSNGSIKTSHPPQEPQDRLESVLALFKGKKTFPKIDLKLKEETYLVLIDKLIDLLKDQGGFILVNISGIKDRHKIMEAEKYFAKKIRNLPNVKMNLDFLRYRPAKQDLGKEFVEHVKSLGNSIHSISLEIYEEDWQSIIKVGLLMGIRHYYFWLRGWPDVPNPRVKVKTILNALELEKIFNIRVFFDINLNHLEHENDS